MKVLGKHDGRAQYTPGRLQRARRLCLRRTSILRAPLLEAVEGALHTASPLVQHVGVDHRRRHVRMSEQLLHRADVVAGFQEVGREGVAQGVAAHALGDAGGVGRLADRALRHRVVQMVTAHHAVLRIGGAVIGRKHVLPDPLPARARYLRASA